MISLFFLRLRIRIEQKITQAAFNVYLDSNERKYTRRNSCANIINKDQPMIGSDIGSGRCLAISVKHRIGKILLSLPIRVPMFGLMKNSALICLICLMPCFLIECE